MEPSPGLGEGKAGLAICPTAVAPRPETWAEHGEKEKEELWQELQRKDLPLPSTLRPWAKHFMCRSHFIMSRSLGSPRGGHEGPGKGTDLLNAVLQVKQEGLNLRSVTSEPTGHPVGSDPCGFNALPAIPRLL